jgi:hypothetical protein
MKDQFFNQYLEALARRYQITNDKAFEILALALVLDKSFDEVVNEIWVTDDGRDGGFDGIFLDLINDEISLFQVKNSLSLTQAELDRLKGDYEKIFAQGNEIGEPLSPRVQKFLGDYKDITRKGKILKVKQFFVYSGSNGDPNNAGNQELFRRYNNPAGIPSFQIIDSDGLYQQAASLQKSRRKPVSFTFEILSSNIEPSRSQTFFSFFIGNVKALNFRLHALELCRLIEQEIKENGISDTLFTENVRGFLGKNQTNKKIKETLMDPSKSFHFPFLNNGITMLCESMNIPTGPQDNQFHVAVTNPLIVNGLQTSRIIYEVYQENKDLLKDVSITIRLYETRDPILIDLITEATNTQTAINYRDKISNKLFNKWAHDYFAGKGVRYISKRGDSIGNSLTEGLAESIGSDTVIKYWYATYYEDPLKAKRSISGVLQDIFLATKEENPQLASLFSGDNESPVYSQLYNAYQIYKYVTAKRKAALDGPDDFIVHADEFLAYGIYKEIEAQGKLDNFDNDVIENAYNKSLDILKEIVTAEQSRKMDAYSHNKYFKSEKLFEDYNEKL